MKGWNSVLLVFCGIGVLIALGCQNSTKEIISHYESMTKLATQTQGSCVAMSEALTQYLEQNGDALKASMANVSSSKDAESRQIYVASQSLEQAMAPCEEDASIQKFKLAFAKIAIEAALKK
ncbi:MAG: hypothetical protein WC966_10210 [Bradymonadales bacterium]